MSRKEHWRAYVTHRSGGSPRTSGGASGDVKHPGAFLGDTRLDVACGAGLVMLQRGHRAACLSWGNRHHVLHARCVVGVLAISATQAPLRYPTAGCGVQHTRRNAVGPRGWNGGSQVTQTCADVFFGTDGIRWREDGATTRCRFPGTSVVSSNPSRPKRRKQR